MSEDNSLKHAVLTDTPIYDITPFTLLDYPEHIGCIVWFSGCNMRCSYCYNPEIVTSHGKISNASLLDLLKTRKGRLEAVVLSGGEATCYPKLKELCTFIKELGYKIKLDTNGSNPTMVKELLKNNLLDYIALDYKAPRSKFLSITKVNSFDSFTKSLDILLTCNIDYEVRTTLHSDLLNEDNINEIIIDLHSKKYTKTYYIQKVQLNTPTIGSLQMPKQEFDISSIDHKVKIEFRAF